MGQNWTSLQEDFQMRPCLISYLSPLKSMGNKICRVLGLSLQYYKSYYVMSVLFRTCAWSSILLVKYVHPFLLSIFPIISGRPLSYILYSI
jgi:hypothetical protein